MTTEKKKTELKAKVYNTKGTGSAIELPENIFAVRWNPDLVHQVIVSMQSNARANTAHTKERDEVRGGGKKPWRQKGTGRARHGSSRSPIWRGGGITFGPRTARNYEKKINAKSRVTALLSALSRKFADGQIGFFEALVFDNPSTKKAHEVAQSFAKIDGFKDVNTKNRTNLLLIVPENEQNIKKSFKNLHHINVIDVHELNPVHIAEYRHIIFTNPAESFKFLESRAMKNNTKK